MPDEGYRPGYLTTVPVSKNIPDGYYAKFEKHIEAWIITDRERPERVTQEQVMLVNLEVQTEPQVI